MLVATAYPTISFYQCGCYRAVKVYIIVIVVDEPLLNY